MFLIRLVLLKYKVYNNTLNAILIIYFLWNMSRNIQNISVPNGKSNQLQVSTERSFSVGTILVMTPSRLCNIYAVMNELC